MFKTTKGPRIRPRLITITGCGGIGKTRAAMNIAKSLNKKALFASFETGSDDLDVERTDPLIGADATSFLNKFLSPGAAKYHGGVLVIDTFDALQLQISKEVATEFGVRDPREVGYAKGKQAMNGRLAREIERLVEIRHTTNTWVIVLVHTEVVTISDPVVGDYDKFAPALYEEASHLLMDKSDEVLFLNYETAVIQEDAGFNRTKGRGVGTGIRKMHTREMPGFYAKIRFACPETLDLPYDGSPYVDHLRQHYMAIKAEQQPKPLETEPAAQEETTAA